MPYARGGSKNSGVWGVDEGGFSLQLRNSRERRKQTVEGGAQHLGPLTARTARVSTAWQPEGGGRAPSVSARAKSQATGGRTPERPHGEGGPSA